MPSLFALLMFAGLHNHSIVVLKVAMKTNHDVIRDGLLFLRRGEVGLVGQCPKDKLLLLVQLLPTKKDHAQPKGKGKSIPKN